MRCCRCCSVVGTTPKPAAGQTAAPHPFQRGHWPEGAPAAMAAGARTGAAPARAASRSEALPAPRSAAIWAPASRLRCRPAWLLGRQLVAATQAASRREGTAIPRGRGAGAGSAETARGEAG